LEEQCINLLRILVLMLTTDIITSKN
jgi:hypothetical protein